MNNNKNAQMVWEGEALKFHGVLGSGYEFDLNSNADPAGGSPMEFLLAAVAGCTAMDVVSMLQKMRQPLEGFVVEIQGARADEHPKVYTDVNVVYVIRGQGVDPQAVERAIELSQEKYCGASIMFKRAGAAVQTSYRIET